MNPVDFRNATWDAIQSHLTGDRERVWRAWQRHGPCTTRQLAERSGIDILTLRPRTTDLVHLGFVACTGSAGREGIYSARSWIEARTFYETEHRRLTEAAQLQLL